MSPLLDNLWKETIFFIKTGTQTLYSVTFWGSNSVTNQIIPLLIVLQNGQMK